MNFLKRTVAALLIATVLGTSADETEPQGCNENEILQNGVCKLLSGQACNETTTCVNGASCNLLGLCECSENAVLQNDATCLTNIGGQCMCASDCLQGFTCDEGTCSCPFGTYHDTGSGLCSIAGGHVCKSNSSWPPCGTGYCPMGRCRCQNDESYNVDTKKCECKGPTFYLYPGVYAMYFQTECNKTAAGKDCFCIPGSIPNDETHSCDCPEYSYPDLDTVTCQCIVQDGNPWNPNDGTPLVCPPTSLLK